jgi:hypothetical protein
MPSVFFTADQAVPCYSVAQCTPCYAGVQSLHVLPGCLHVACCLHACFLRYKKKSIFCRYAIIPCFAWMPTCCLYACFLMYKKNSIICQCAITPCIAWMPPCCLLPPCMFSDVQEKLHILPVCNHSIFYLDASMLPVASILVFRCIRKIPYFASVQSLHVLPGCLHAACCLNACFPLCKKNSIFCQCAITPCFPGYNHHMYCGLRSSCWAVTPYFVLVQ